MTIAMPSAPPLPGRSIWIVALMMKACVRVRVRAEVRMGELSVVCVQRACGCASSVTPPTLLSLASM